MLQLAIPGRSFVERNDCTVAHAPGVILSRWQGFCLSNRAICWSVDVHRICPVRHSGKPRSWVIFGSKSDVVTGVWSIPVCEVAYLHELLCMQKQASGLAARLDVFEHDVHVWVCLTANVMYI